MSRFYETRDTSWHETCTCRCRLHASVCNNKQRWNVDVHAKNWLTQVYVIKDLFEVLVIVNVSVLDQVMLENIRLWQLWM